MKKVHPTALYHPALGQRGCAEIIPHLSASPVWSLQKLEARSREEALSTGQQVRHHTLARFMERLQLPQQVLVIKQELLAFVQANGLKSFKQYQKPGLRLAGQKPTHQGTWGVAYLLLHNVDTSQTRAYFKHTLALLHTLGSRLYPHCFFSVVEAESRIHEHNGPTNKKLRFHLPLIVPEASTGVNALVVGAEECVIREGEVLVFDDSFRHSSYNEARSKRVTLIFDVWHPDLSDQEVRVLGFLERAKLARDKVVSKQYLKSAPRGSFVSLYSELEEDAAAGHS